MIQQAFIDMENMFDLLAQSQEVRPLFSRGVTTLFIMFFCFKVKDIPNAPSLRTSHAGVVFDNVSFAYDPV